MKVIVFGASGKTGRLVVERARASGHAVTAFTRGGTGFGEGVRVATGDAGDAEAVRRAVADQDAVIGAIGGRTPYRDTDLETAAARHILAGMKGGSARRFVVVSALGVGDSAGQAPFLLRYVLIPTFLRGSTKDKAAMEAAVRSSGVPFVIVRPSILNDRPATGAVRVVAAGETARSITRADLARFLVDQLESDAHLDGSVVVTND